MGGQILFAMSWTPGVAVTAAIVVISALVFGSDRLFEWHDVDLAMMFVCLVMELHRSRGNDSHC